ncbi:hypothetical protein A8L34_21825 [Bacillus sp. FJAT-27264]|uniref:DUF6612 family protein n=1 Tax=Paenibacillus sp. (strain DSM 101736 / FJAT-27264) TaxID=1850362 RepID=UPI000807C095|nr:DUF6612 family protein [Bacillus sp. FJAT-27264]OBZ08802.1 hypothetical protein A8L34_21825 [Bacillus sp. FJAT-27264]
MKKWTTVLLGAFLTISLTACGNNEGAKNTAGASDPVATTATNEVATNGDAKSGTPTVEELIQKTTEASQSLQSFAMESKIEQNIKMKQGETSQDQKVNMTMTSEIIKEPMQMHQEILMDLAGQGEQKIEQYITADGIYTHTGEEWIKLPSEMTAQMTEMVKESGSPEKQLEQFKSIAKDTKISEEGDTYLLTAEVSGDSVKELAKSYLDQASNGDPQMTALMEQMNIKSMKISYAVDKKTYLPTKTNVDMVMDMEASGQNISLDMKMTGDLSKHNEIKEIKVPDEAKNAQEVQIPAA